jgi:hypothetical protein
VHITYARLAPDQMTSGATSQDVYDLKPLQISVMKRAAGAQDSEEMRR